jgi:hypothetical protein
VTLSMRRGGKGCALESENAIGTCRGRIVQRNGPSTMPQACKKTGSGFPRTLPCFGADQGTWHRDGPYMLACLVCSDLARWFRLYGEVTSDPKILKLTEVQNPEADRSRSHTLAVNGARRRHPDSAGKKGESPVKTISRLTLPQELAATFLYRLNAGFVGVFGFQNAAIAPNESRTAQVETWKIRGI